MKEPFKPCAHCGATVRLSEHSDGTVNGKTLYKIICGRCGIRTCWYATKSSLKRMWNRRSVLNDNK